MSYYGKNATKFELNIGKLVKLISQSSDYREWYNLNHKTITSTQEFPGIAKYLISKLDCSADHAKKLLEGKTDIAKLELNYINTLLGFAQESRELVKGFTVDHKVSVVDLALVPEGDSGEIFTIELPENYELGTVYTADKENTAIMLAFIPKIEQEVGQLTVDEQPLDDIIVTAGANQEEEEL